MHLSLSIPDMVSLAVQQPSPDVSFARIQEFMQRDDLRWLINYNFAIVIGALLLNAFWCWLASMIVIRGELATVGNALRVWIGGSFLPVAVAMALFFFGPLIFKSLVGVSGEVIWAMVGLFVLVCFMIFLLIPIQTYEIDFIHALGYVLLVLVLCIGGAWGGARLAGNHFDVPARKKAFEESMGRTETERFAFGKRLGGLDDPDEITRGLDDLEFPIGKPKPQADREAAVQTIQKQLEAKRATLPPKEKDEAANTAFQQQLDRYMRVMEQVKTGRTEAPATTKSN
jgi:hypothetical protein